MKIFLDDDPIRDSWVTDEWTIVRSPYEAVQRIVDNEERPVEVLSLDHDLGLEGEFSSGYDLMKLIEIWANSGWWDLVPERFEIHSANPVGRKNMQAAIDSIERMRNG